MLVQGSVQKVVYENNNFAIKSFIASDAVRLPNGSFTRFFKIKGMYLPTSYLDVELEGDFDAKPFVSKSGQKYFTFKVETSTEVKKEEEICIIKYLNSLNGVGKTLARRIYERFGNKTFEILDEDIYKLREIDGIGDKTLSVISSDYLSRGVARKLYAYLYKFNVPNGKIEKIYRRYRGTAYEKVSTAPYSLYMQNMITFGVAEKIAKGNNLNNLSNERIQASIVEALKKAESCGHTYLTWRDILEESEKLLEVIGKSDHTRREVAKMIRSNAKLLIGTYIAVKKIEDETLFYRKETYVAETEAAENIKRLASDVTTIDYTDDILEAEEKLNIHLSDEQRSAVQTAMNSSISIVTGGPGTGKTSFQKVLYSVFKKHSDKPIVLAAPTGRAATRMTQSSGLPARTIHQMLHLVVTEDDSWGEPEPIEAGLVVIDEMSMVDITIAYKLFMSIQQGTRVVCVGDAFQLPSVGCGEVLQDMIRSNVIPVTLFTKVFRQQDGSIIAANAAEINKGGQNLEYGPAFELVKKTKSDDIKDEVLDQYRKALKDYGPDETTILTPYRRTTVTGVNELNPLLKQIYNPFPSVVTRYNKIDKTDIYKGDKVMFTKNAYVNNILLSNGDIGYVTDIVVEDNIQKVEIDFKDGRIVTLIGDDVKHLVPAFATTVHKSQGSEYKCCIIVIDPKHSILLKRNLVYTAITRSKEKVILVGDEQAFYQSILLEDTGTRKTMLKYYLEQ